MPDTLTTRVAAGAAWLDKHSPGWEAFIDLGQLDLGSGCRCILGQLTGSYAAGEREYDMTGCAHLYGFNVDPFCTGPIEDGYASLTAEWKRLIGQRRAAP